MMPALAPVDEDLLIDRMLADPSYFRAMMRAVDKKAKGRYEHMECQGTFRRHDLRDDLLLFLSGAFRRLQEQH